MSLLEATLRRIEPVDRAWIIRAEERQKQLTKPPESLGRLEEIANRLVAIQETLAPSTAKARIIVFAADHGVCAEGVNPYPQAVTGQMVGNFLRGGAAINALAAAVGAELRIVDIGVVSEIAANDSLVSRRAGSGTQNFCQVPAMTREQAVVALETGIDMAEQAAAQGCQLLAIGEMGIGNTTAASALTAALTGLEPAAVAGRGTGADDDCLARKISAIERAIVLHGPYMGTPLAMMERLGGFEIAGMAGCCLGAAARRRAVLIDGFIAAAAAALAIGISPAVRDYLFASHRSTEPGHEALLALLGQKPLFDLHMRLGEGTGAALAIPIIRAAAAAFTGMATFEAAGVAERENRVSRP